MQDANINMNMNHDSELSLRHVTIRQILKSVQVFSNSDSKACFQIDGTGCHKAVVIVANLQESQSIPKGVRVDHVLDDGTGRIRACEWIDAKEQSRKYVNFEYVRVAGDIEQYEGSKSITVKNIQPLGSNAYEVYYHLLQTIVDSISCKEGPPPPAPTSVSMITSSQSAFTGVSDKIIVAESERAITSAPKDPVNAKKNPSILEYGRISPDSREIGKGFTRTLAALSSVKQSDEGAQHTGTNSSHSPKIPGPSHFKSAQPPSPLATSRKSGKRAVCNEGHQDVIESEVGRLETPMNQSHSGSSSKTPVQKPESSRLSKPRPVSPQTPAKPKPPLGEVMSPSLRVDPLSHLTNLQRDIVLYIKQASHGVDGYRSIYPTYYDQKTQAAWAGISISEIVRAINSRYQPPISDEFINQFEEAVETLIELKYIGNPVDDEHFVCLK